MKITVFTIFITLFVTVVYYQVNDIDALVNPNNVDVT